VNDLKVVRIGIVGDFNPANASHAATNEAVKHCAEEAVDARWIGTEEVTEAALADCDGLWIAPASPYRSMEGALMAIRFARENGVPLLGTCGGFQHIILEHARNVLGIADAEHEESNPGAAQLFISRLACSLKGRKMKITVEPESMLARLYGRTTAEEGYYCNFGVNPNFVETLRSSGLRIAASDGEGEIRAVELAGHPFFLGTLFLPQHNSRAGAPHPVIRGFLRSVK